MSRTRSRRIGAASSRFASSFLFCNNGLYARDAILTRHRTRKGRERQRQRRWRTTTTGWSTSRHGQSPFSLRHIGTEPDSRDLNWFRDKCVELKMHSDDHPRSFNPFLPFPILVFHYSSLYTLYLLCVAIVSFPSFSLSLSLLLLLGRISLGTSRGYICRCWRIKRINSSGSFLVRRQRRVIKSRRKLDHESRINNERRKGEWRTVVPIDNRLFDGTLVVVVGPGSDQLSSVCS